MADLCIRMIYALDLMGGQRRLACVPDLSYLRGLIREYGITVPILIDKHLMILSGCEVFLAACSLGTARIPCVVLDELPVRVQQALLELSQRQLTDPDWPALGQELDRIT